MCVCVSAHTYSHVYMCVWGMDSSWGSLTLKIPKSPGPQIHAWTKPDRIEQKIHNLLRIFRGFNTLLLIEERTGQKMDKEAEDLENSVNQLELAGTLEHSIQQQ